MTESLHLFVIEDDPETALLIRRHLERAGHHVTPLPHGRRRPHRAPPYRLRSGPARSSVCPTWAAWTSCTFWAQEGISVPVLIVTRDKEAETATRVLRAGALDYIIKDTALTFLGELPKRVSESVTRHRLEQMNRLLVQALESARDGIMITDLQGSILKVNQALENLTGYSRQELLGPTPRSLKSLVHRPELYEEMWRTILDGRSWQGELTNRRKDGSLFQASMTISPIVDSQGRLTHFVGIQRDITEHKQLERSCCKRQKMQSVGTLAGGVAHEFNNLLAGINGYASLGLREPEAGPTLREFHPTYRGPVRAGGLADAAAAGFRPQAGPDAGNAAPMTDLLRDTAELVGGRCTRKWPWTCPPAERELAVAR